MNKIQWAIIAFVLGSCCCLIYLEEFYFKYPVQVVRDDFESYKKNNLKKSGFTLDSSGRRIPYTVRSFDGGKNWYASTEDPNEIIIKGNLIDVYPWLVDFIRIESKYGQPKNNNEITIMLFDAEKENKKLKDKSSKK
jgi:hypothetical protein